MFTDLLKAIFSPAKQEEQFVGILEDDRPESEKAKDWEAEEIASSGSMVPTFRKVSKGKWKKYTVRDQDGSGSCVSQAIAKGLEVLYNKETGETVMFSSTPIYQPRKNAPDGGMYIHDAFGIVLKNSTCKESDCRSQQMNDKQMDAQKIPDNFEDLNNLLEATAYVSMPRDFDYVAAWIEQHGYASIHIAADRKNWSKDFPSLGSKSRSISHAVAGVDAVNYNGTEYIVIEDSWGEFGEFKGQRLISREVFYDMFTRGAGFTVLQYNTDKKKKFAPFKTWMEIGQKSEEISRFQDYLKAKGFFPKNVESTGYYGPITALAVYNFQIANNIASPVLLNKYKGKYSHKMTLDVVNKNL